MMWDEQQLRDALREEIDKQPAPTVKTELSDIMSRGTRRRRFRQIGSVAAAVAVVAGVGVVAMTVGGKPSLVNEPAQESDIPVVIPLTASWGRADLQPRKPLSTWTPQADAPPLPDVPKEGLPRCDTNFKPGDPDPDPAPMPADVQERLVGTLRTVAAPARLGELKTSSDATSFQYTVDITDDRGTGSIRAWSERSPGEPLSTADSQAFDENNCPPPKRLVKPSGAIAQIYPVRPTYDHQTQAFGGIVTQGLFVYLPDRLVVRIQVQNYGDKDLGPRDATGVRPWIGPGRPSLPLTEYQLSQLGEGLLG